MVPGLTSLPAGVDDAGGADPAGDVASVVPEYIGELIPGGGAAGDDGAVGAGAGTV